MRNFPSKYKISILFLLPVERCILLWLHLIIIVCYVINWTCVAVVFVLNDDHDDDGISKIDCIIC